MDIGSLADWVGAVGGVAAVVASLIAWRVSARMLELECERDMMAQARVRREQAELVFVLGAVLPEHDGRRTFGIYLFNGSSKPVFDVCVESQRLKGGRSNVPLKLGALPPGRFVVASDIQYGWGSLVDLSLSPEPVELLVKGKGNDMITHVEFGDSTRRTWELMKGTELREAVL